MIIKNNGCAYKCTNAFYITEKTYDAVAKRFAFFMDETLDSWLAIEDESEREERFSKSFREGWFEFDYDDDGKLFFKVNADSPEFTQDIEVL